MNVGEPGSFEVFGPVPRCKKNLDHLKSVTLVGIIVVMSFASYNETSYGCQRNSHTEAKI